MSALERFRGGRAYVGVAGALGAACLVATLVDVAIAPRRALFSYLFAWLYWGGLVLGTLLFLSVLHAVKARWIVVLRRMIETIAGAFPLMAVLFVPVLAGMSPLFAWVEPRGLEEELGRLVAHKHAYLNVWFFVLRAVAYFALWVGVSEALLRWSRRSDEEPPLALVTRQRRLAAGALPAVALAASFAALDWVMSLEPRFSSTIFGLYFFTGLFLGAIALVALVTELARGDDLFGSLANRSHRASLGKLMLGFVTFWFYVAFDQYMLIWIADVPGEVRWYLVRTTGGWHVYTIILVIAQFLVPFLLLLSRPLKRSHGGLAFLAAWILLAHLLDTWWMVMPARDSATPVLRWTDVTAFLGMGGVASAFVVWRLRGHRTVPVNDPYLSESLRYAGR